MSTIYKEFHRELKMGLTIRMVESRLLRLFSEGRINGTIHTCIGQEMIGVMVSRYLQVPDFVVSNHRGHGHYIARTLDIKGLIAEVMGKRSGPSLGVGGSQHLVNTNYLSNGIQGGMAPIAAGVALARSFDAKSDESRPVSVVYIGDGTLGEGLLWETLNLCSLWSIPIVFVLEDNGYAQSTSKNQTFAGDICARMKGFGVRYLKADSNDLSGLDQACQQALIVAREKSKPTLLHVKTYRLNSHSKGDDNRFTSEVSAADAIDIINVFSCDEPKLFEQWKTSIETELDEIIAELVEHPDLSETGDLNDFEYFYHAKSSWSEVSDTSDQRINDEIHSALETILSSKDAFILGEDIEGVTKYTDRSYGGAFKVTRDLSNTYPGRVRNTPISEAATVGVGTGFALAGKTSIIEIMFGDFITLAIDQLAQHAAKFKSMYGGKVKAPVLIRTPMGGGRGYGPTHSQSFEALLYSILGLRLVVLNRYVPPSQLYDNLLSSEEPVVVVENKKLYTQRRSGVEVSGYLLESDNADFPTCRIRPRDFEPNITIVTYGEIAKVAEESLESLEAEEIFAEVIVLSCIKPTNIAPVLQSVQQTKRLLTLEETNFFGGPMASLIAELNAMALDFRSASIGVDKIIPCSIEAEKKVLPNVYAVVSKCQEML
jgi:2-oxoisovalerate dehydrogenase E1 component